MVLNVRVDKVVGEIDPREGPGQDQEEPNYRHNSEPSDIFGSSVHDFV